jgi:hypothetical protein
MELTLTMIARDTTSRKGSAATNIVMEKEKDGILLPRDITHFIGMKFRLIPAGSFLMAASWSDTEECNDEKPRYRLEITKPSCLGIHEMIRAQYSAVAGNSHSHFKGDDLNVSSMFL